MSQFVESFMNFTNFIFCVTLSYPKLFSVFLYAKKLRIFIEIFACDFIPAWMCELLTSCVYLNGLYILF